MVLNRGIGAIHGGSALKSDSADGASANNTPRSPIARSAPAVSNNPEPEAVDRDVDTYDDITEQEDARNTGIERSDDFTGDNVESALVEISSSTTTVTGRVTTLESDVDAVEANITSIEANIITIEAEVEANSVQDACLVVTDSDTDVEIANGIIPLTIPPKLNGMVLDADTTASVHTAGVTNQMDIQVRRHRSGVDADMLSTKIIFGTPNVYIANNGVVNAATSTVQTGDQIYIDIDAIHTTPAKGLSVTLVFKTA